MILNINKCASQKQTQTNLLSTQSFLQKNKITVNEVSQAHYTVEGVQAYSPDQIKALKQIQQRKKKMQGTIVEVKVYQCGDYFDEFEEGRQLTPKEKVTQALKNKSKLDVKNGLGSDAKVQVKEKVTNRDKMMRNNNVVAKLQKERNKKSAIEQKLSKLSKHYKEYFKGSSKNEAQDKDENNQEPNIQEQEQQQNEEDQADIAKNRRKSKQKKSVMYESLKKIIKSKDSQDEQQDEQQKDNKNKPSKIDNSRNITFKKNNQKAFSVASTHETKPTKNANKPKAKPSKQLQQEEQDQGSQTQSKGQVQELQDKLDSISQISKKNKSTYSQKLGSAVHLLFM